MQFWAMIIDSFRESLDRKIFWVIIAISVFVALAMVSVGFEGDRVTMLFGAVDLETDAYSPLSSLGRTKIVGLVVFLLASTVLGWIGVLLTIVATGSVFPSMMDRGSVDVLLGKPLSRSTLFLYKYLASMVFVLVQATVFVGLTFLVMGLRWHVWAPGYLLAIPLAVLLFSYVYCVSVLVAVRTGSTVAAVLLSIGAWTLFALVHQAPAAFEAIPMLKERTTLYAAVRVISWIPPKTGDFPYIVSRWSGGGTSIDVLPAEAMRFLNAYTDQQIEDTRRYEAELLAANPWYSIGSSLLFEAVIVVWGMFAFARKDF